MRWLKTQNSWVEKDSEITIICMIEFYKYTIINVVCLMDYSFFYVVFIIFCLCSAGEQPTSSTVFLSHVPPAPASSSSLPNSVFLSQHSSSSFQLQPAEHGASIHHMRVRCCSRVSEDEYCTNSADGSRVFHIPIMRNRCLFCCDLHCIQPIKRIP